MNRNTPRQARAQKRVAEILTAAREVIAEHGRDRFTTQQVAERAGCSIGILYRYFDDRVDLLATLYPNRVEGLDGVALLAETRAALVQEMRMQSTAYYTNGNDGPMPHDDMVDALVEAGLLTLRGHEQVEA